MKTYFIDFTVQDSDDFVFISQVFSVNSRDIDFASTVLEHDLLLLHGILPRDFRVVYDLSKIYCYGE